MMEYLISKIIDHINEEMPSLSLLDEDYGQLEALDNNDSDMYPLTFPSVLVNNDGTEWSCINGKSQQGVATISVRFS